MPSIFATTILVGFVIAAPIGPASLLCIRRTLAEGRGAGLRAGLGAALADAFAAGLSAIGVSLLSGPLSGHTHELQLLFGAALIAAGYRAATHTSSLSATPAARDLAAAAGAFVLTLANPATVLAFAATFGTLGLAGEGIATATWAAAGVFCGASLWWLLLCTAAQSLGNRERRDG